jgi:hypothetical protein
LVFAFRHAALSAENSPAASVRSAHRPTGKSQPWRHATRSLSFL